MSDPSRNVLRNYLRSKGYDDQFLDRFFVALGHLLAYSERIDVWRIQHSHRIRVGLSRSIKAPRRFTSEDDKKIVYLRDVKKMSWGDISRAMKCESRSSIRSAYSREKALRDVGYDPGAFEE